MAERENHRITGSRSRKVRHDGPGGSSNKGGWGGLSAKGPRTTGLSGSRSIKTQALDPLDEATRPDRSTRSQARRDEPAGREMSQQRKQQGPAGRPIHPPTPPPSQARHDEPSGRKMRQQRLDFFEMLQRREVMGRGAGQLWRESAPNSTIARRRAAMWRKVVKY